MTSAVNIDAGRNEVALMCTKLDVRIAEIETLASGGTRVVFTSPQDAQTIKEAYETLLIAEPAEQTDADRIA